MKKIKLFGIPLLLSLFFIFLSGTFVVRAERERQLKKRGLLEDYYSEVYLNWEEYKNNYELQVELLREENRQGMEMAKEEYEDLLSQQPALIAEHTRTVEDESYVPQEYTASSGSQSTTKKVIKVAKPKSTPTTSAS